MVRRILRLLAAISAFFLFPIWLVYWVFTGVNMMTMLMDFAVNNESFAEQRAAREKQKIA
jgi:hypothetical protein